jgi:glutamate synthase domain-containing protein 1
VVKVYLYAVTDNKLHLNRKRGVVADLCSILGIVNESGRLFSASYITKGISLMNERCNGLGGGFAAYGLYPEYKDYYAFHIFLKDFELKDKVAEMLQEHVNIYKDEEIETRNVSGISHDYIPWRFFVDVPERYAHDADNYIIDLTMKINNAGDGLVVSSGKNMGVFKAIGYPDQVAELYKLEKYKAYMWLAHGRYPTNTRGWWGGAHPFSILDCSIVHNGEITSYGTNRRFLELYGYKCSYFTDSEVLAYLWDLLVRRQKLPVELASEVLAPPFWEQIQRMPPEKRQIIEALRMTYGPAMVNGPFGIVIANGSGLTGIAGNGKMVGLSDRIKLRPLVCAQKDEFTFMASEESAIKAVCKNPDVVWAPGAGKPTVALVNGNV